MLAPIVRGADDDAMAKGLLARSGEEAVQVTFLNSIIFGVELALNCMVFCCAMRLCNKVDTRIAPVQALLLPNRRTSTHRCRGLGTSLRFESSKR